MYRGHEFLLEGFRIYICNTPFQSVSLKSFIEQIKPFSKPDKKMSQRPVTCFWICWAIMFVLIILFLSHIPNGRTCQTGGTDHVWETAGALFRLHKMKPSYLLKTKCVIACRQAVRVRNTTGLPPWAQFLLTSVHLKPSKAILPPIRTRKDFPKILLPWWMRSVFSFPASVYSLPRHTHFSSLSSV